MLSTLNELLNHDYEKVTKSVTSRLQKTISGNILILRIDVSNRV